jgi:dihydroorotate dehydrogenase
MAIDRFALLAWGWRSLVRPVLFRIDAEKTHEQTGSFFSRMANFPGLARLTTATFRVNDPRLRVTRFGIQFPNPVGLAAGMDKNAEWFGAFSTLGFGFLEVGTLTAQTQTGNPKPRIFRLPKDQALINRMGSPNKGATAAAEFLSHVANLPILGINIGKSAAVPLESAAGDYLESFERLFPFASYFTLNISSPNTVGLRNLQATDALSALLGELMQKNKVLAQARGCEPKPIMVKIAPDLTDDQLESIVALCGTLRVAGLIVANTTIAREGLETSAQAVQGAGAGGLSGAPLTNRSRKLVAKVYGLSKGAIPIIGVGGIMSGEDAWEMFRAGASLIQVYTGLIYGGPSFVAEIKRYILKRLSESGKTSIEEVVGEASRASLPGPCLIS